MKGPSFLPNCAKNLGCHKKKLSSFFHSLRCPAWTHSAVHFLRRLPHLLFCHDVAKKKVIAALAAGYFSLLGKTIGEWICDGKGTQQCGLLVIKQELCSAALCSALLHLLWTCFDGPTATAAQYTTQL